MTAWFAAFVATCIVEVAVVRAFVRHAPVSVVIGAQLATHPAVWLAMAVLGGPQLARLGLVELWATAVEAAIYARWLRLSAGNAFTISAAANAASLLAVALAQ